MVGRTLVANRLLAGSACGKRRRGRPLNSVVRHQAMRRDTLEIYSDATSAAVLRHPGRRFPGILVQGDTLYALCAAADASCKASQGRLGEEEYLELNELRNRLWDLLNHYKQVLG